MKFRVSGSIPSPTYWLLVMASLFFLLVDLLACLRISQPNLNAGNAYTGFFFEKKLY